MSTPDIDPLDALPPLRDVIAAHGLAARKSLGQNFLLDLNLTAKIARSPGSLEGVHVLEVGPGPGGLTRGLLRTAAASVTAVEMDSRCIEALAPLVAAANGRLRIVHGDALDIDAVELLPAPRAVVANLPYNVATPLLFGWLRRINEFRSLTLMFQREVAERLFGTPRTPDYGRLSVMTQWAAECRRVSDLSPAAFTPPPKVHSTVVEFRPRQHTSPQPTFAVMERLVAAAFGQRRKMLRQSLKSLGAPPEMLCAAAGVAETARAEEVTVAGFVAMALALQGSGQGPGTHTVSN
jgi:16S rRNA (adenine1518-N6/adenine1519-N6)-dimethyltransferase